jgi:hypothetical protein
MSKNKIMELGNQKDVLHSIIYHMIFFKAYEEKQLIIDRTLSTTLWNKMNCEMSFQYMHIL